MDVSPRIRFNLSFVSDLLNPKALWGSPVEESPIDYSYIDKKTVLMLSKSGLPLHSPTPFRFDYLEVLGPCLPRHAKPDLFFNAVVDLMIREYDLWFGRRAFTKEFNSIASWQKTAEEILKRKAQERGTEIVDYQSMQVWIPHAKWIVDSIIFRLRAIWDVMLVFISEHALGFQLHSKTFEKKRVELGNKATGKSLTEVQGYLVDTFQSMTGDIGWLKDYRDTELHRTGRRFVGALSHEKTHEHISDAWANIVVEHNRAREGLIVVLGVVVAERT